MQKKHGKKLKASFKYEHCFLVFLSFLFLFVFIIICTQFLNWGYHSPKTLSSINTYKSEEYVLFDSGKEFQKFIENFEFTPQNEPVEFYYVDNSKRDSVVFGKMCDIYILELDVTNEDYPQLEECINSFSLKKSGTYGNYEIFSKNVNKIKMLYCMAIDKKNHKIRYIMIDNCDSENVYAILLRQCNVPFS